MAAVTRPEFDALLADHAALKEVVGRTQGLLQETVTAQNKRLQEFEDGVKAAVARTVAEADAMFGKHKEVLEEHQKNFEKQKSDL
jgi:hypothetical protein